MFQYILLPQDRPYTGRVMWAKFVGYLVFNALYLADAGGAQNLQACTGRTREHIVLLAYLYCFTCACAKGREALSI